MDLDALLVVDLVGEAVKENGNEGIGGSLEPIELIGVATLANVNPSGAL